MWAPWLFSALAFLIGWLLRGWYDDKKIDQIREIVKTKDNDIYHLHEAHELLLNDKEKRLKELSTENDIQRKTITELNTMLEQSEESTKSLLSSVVASKKKEKKRREAAKVVNTPLPVATIDQDDLKKELLEETKSEKEIDMEVKEETKVTEKSNDDDTIALLKKKVKSLSKKLKKARRQRGKKRTIVKEIPVTILKTVRIKESLDKERLNEILEDIPIIKTKETIKKKKKKGKPRIVKK